MAEIFGMGSEDDPIDVTIREIRLMVERTNRIVDAYQAKKDVLDSLSTAISKLQNMKVHFVDSDVNTLVGYHTLKQYEKHNTDDHQAAPSVVLASDVLKVLQDLKSMLVYI